ncbi:MAG: hypothetical protein WBR29_05330 [Gammaproteobacteria bacterium]
MSTETVHYHYGQDSYRIQYDVTRVTDTSSTSPVSNEQYRTSQIRIKALGAGSPLKYFDYTKDFETLITARHSTTEYAKALVRHAYLKGRNKRESASKPL